MEVIRTTGLCKYFGNTKAVEDITIQVGPGEIYGFLGLNGAGKTTVIRLLLGMIKPAKGQVTLFGQPILPGFNLWNEVGYLVEIPFAYPNLTVLENLKVIHKLRDLKSPTAIEEIIYQLKLEKFARVKAGNLSLGNQQRLGLAKALMHRPSLLILDEPINGLDPEGIVEVRNLLLQLSATGTTIFISSHILSEIAKIAHRIGIVHEGRLIRELNTTELNVHIQKKLLVSTLQNDKAKEVLSQLGYKLYLNDEGELEILNPEVISEPEFITQLLCDNRLPPVKILTQAEDLEHFFLRTIQENTA